MSIPPKNFGVLNEGHSLKDLGPWSGSIEPLFQKVDSEFKYLIEELYSLDSLYRRNSNFSERLHPQELAKDRLDLLCECVISLVARSPAHRNGWSVTANHYRDGLDTSKHDAHNLIVGNISNEYRMLAQNARRSPRIIVMYSDDSEFTFADGFLNNYHGIAPGSDSRCVVPLTPEIAVGLFRPMRWSTSSRLQTIRLTADEVGFINYISQVYTRDYVYFRSQQPAITDEFRRREFLVFEYHKHPFIDALMEASARHHMIPQ